MFSLSVNLQNDIRLRFDAKVVGFFDDFPTMYPEGNPLVIANLDYLEMNAGILPHDIWLKLEPGAGADNVLVGINQLRVPLRQVKDLDLALRTESGRLERTGIFGLLSFCFIAGAMLSVADVLVYTTSMLRERALRHAVLQALGVERRTVLITVVYEQAISLIYGLAVGIAGGVVCAQLYGPFLPLGSGRNPPIPPFIPYVDWSRTWWIALFTGGALVLAQFIVLARLTRTHLFEALRMGDRP
jgi:putative ABC transport system permease protein